MKAFKPPSSRKREEKEKKGGGAALGPAAGTGAGADLGGSIGAADSLIGTTATVGSKAVSSPLAAAVRALGLASPLSKTGVAVILLAGSIAAVGVSWLIGGRTESGRPSSGLAPSPFSRAQDGPAASGASVPTAGPGPSSLDYFATANREPEEPQLPETPPAPETAKAAMPAVPGASQPPLALPPAVKPAMRKTKGLPVGGSAGAGASKIELAKVQSLSGGPEGRFQSIYKAGPTGQSSSIAKAQKPPRYGTNKRTAVLSSGDSALAQARFTNRMSRRGAAMGSANSAASYAAAPFDASNPAGRSSALGETGSGVRDLSSNNSGDMRAIDPPPPPETPEETKNKTPYQGLIYAAMAALMIGTMLVQVAGKLVSAAQTNPMAAPQLLAAAQALAAAAAGAGGTAVGLGAMVADEYKQITQGLPFIIGGAIVAAKAAEVIIKAQAAGSEAEAGVNEAAGSSAADALQALQGLSGLGQQQEPEKPKEDPPEPIGDSTHQPADTAFRGDIPEN